MSHFILTPNPPMDTDGRREDTGRGVRKLQKRWSGLDSGRREVGGGLQALLGAPMAAYSGCGEGDGGIGHGKRRSRTGLARVGGDVGSVADGRRQAGSGMARSRARARLNWVSQGQRCGRCRVRRLCSFRHSHLAFDTGLTVLQGFLNEGPRISLGPDALQKSSFPLRTRCQAMWRTGNPR